MHRSPYTRQRIHSRPAWQPALGVSLNNTTELKTRLIREIKALEQQMDQLKIAPERVDFAQMQAFKEMIHDRRELLEKLRRH